MAGDEAVISSPTIDQEKVLTFPRGIPGFEKYTTYLIYHKEENDLSAYWLESTEDPEITFTIVDPGQYGLSYDMEITEEEKKCPPGAGRRGTRGIYDAQQTGRPWQAGAGAQCQYFRAGGHQPTHPPRPAESYPPGAAEHHHHGK